MNNIYNGECCIFPFCKVIPSYGYFNVDIPIYCSRHKIRGMIIIRNFSQDTCKHPGCKIRPTFSYPCDKKSGFCKKHKALGMVNRRIPLCKICERRGVYGNKIDDLYCVYHSNSTMKHISTLRKRMKIFVRKYYFP